MVGKPKEIILYQQKCLDSSYSFFFLIFLFFTFQITPLALFICHGGPKVLTCSWYSFALLSPVAILWPSCFNCHKYIIYIVEQWIEYDICKRVIAGFFAHSKLFICVLENLEGYQRRSEKVLIHGNGKAELKAVLAELLHNERK